MRKQKYGFFFFCIEEDQRLQEIPTKGEMINYKPYSTVKIYVRVAKDQTKDLQLINKVLHILPQRNVGKTNIRSFLKHLEVYLDLLVRCFRVDLDSLQ